MKKIICTGVAAALLSALSLTYAFDWPQRETGTESFFSYFGQLRGGRIASSLIFKDDSDITSAEDGDIAVIIREHNDDFGWFESPLGNAVIVGHRNNIATVYGNLDGSTIPEALEDRMDIKAGDMLGTSGNSGWQEGQSCLEFQVLDTKNRTAVNPRLLMPRMGAELPLVIGELTLDDRNGTTHSLLNERNLTAGIYSLYHPRQETAVPYRTVVSINGTTVESIPYDTLYEYKDRLCISGNANYPVKTLYPDAKRQLLSTVRLTHGHSTLSVTLFNILGQTQTITYNLEIN